MELKHGHLADLDLRTFHDLLKLRIDVFVVEQECPYPELDGHDVEQGTEHVWFEDEQGPASYIRILAEPDGALRVGRVCTRKDARGAGLSGRLLQDFLAHNPTRVTRLEAQSHLAGWYARFGYAVSGPDYVEDGIPHTPMTRPADRPTA